MLREKYYKFLLSPSLAVLSVLFLFLTMISCSKDMDNTDTLEVSTLSPTSLAQGGELVLDVKSNTNWKLGKINASWLQVNTSEGLGDGQLQFICEPNASVQPRSVEFFIVTTNDGKYHKVVFTQFGKDPFIDLELEELEVGSRPRSHVVNVSTNIPSGAILAEVTYEDSETENWIVGINIVDGELRFQTALNSVTKERTASIILSYENLSDDDIEIWDRINVRQLASGNELPSEVKNFSYVKALPLGDIVENISIVGHIVSTGVSDNFKKNTYIIQDGNGSAIAFEGVENLVFTPFEKVQLLLDGTQMATFEESGTQYRVIRGIGSPSILSRQTDNTFTVPVVPIGSLTDNHLLALVKLPNVEFAVPYGAYSNFNEFYAKQSYADHLTKHYPAPIRDISGSSMYLITNKEVSYRRKSVPEGSGNITGLVVKISNSEYGNLGNYSIRHLEESAIGLQASRSSSFSNTLVEWEFAEITTTFPVATTAPGNPGSPFLAPTTGPSSVILKKEGSSGIYAGYTASGGTYLLEKYRGDFMATTNSNIVRSGYNVNGWGTGKYWIVDNISTLGINKSLSLQFEANSGTTTGPRDFAVEYSIDGNTWTRVSTYQLRGQVSTTVTQDVYPGFMMFTYKLPDEVLNKPNVKIRLINISNASVSGGTTVVSSTSRLTYLSLKYNK